MDDIKEDESIRLIRPLEENINFLSEYSDGKKTDTRVETGQENKNFDTKFYQADSEIQLPVTDVKQEIYFENPSILNLSEENDLRDLDQFSHSSNLAGILKIYKYQSLETVNKKDSPEGIDAIRTKEFKFDLAYYEPVSQSLETVQISNQVYCEGSSNSPSLQSLNEDTDLLSVSDYSSSAVLPNSDLTDKNKITESNNEIKTSTHSNLKLKIKIKRLGRSQYGKPTSQQLKLKQKKGLNLLDLNSSFVFPDCQPVNSITFDDANTWNSGNIGTSTLMDINNHKIDTGILQEKWPGKYCALCNLNEKSCLGQGELFKCDPTFNFDPFSYNILKEKSYLSPDQETSLSKSIVNVIRKQRDSIVSKSLKESVNNLTDELSLVGFEEKPDLSHLFESTGHCYAHFWCAAWSDGVSQSEEETFISVDKAVVAGAIQKCSCCRKFGATVVCKLGGCNHIYHYPCAVSGGAILDIKTMCLLCCMHAEDATLIAGFDVVCSACQLSKDFQNLLFCTICGQHFHGKCLEPPLSVNTEVRAGWQCPSCKLCQICRHSGNEFQIIVCSSCDKGYHSSCVRPVINSIPKHGWKCKNCRLCTDCGSRTPGSGPSSRWHNNFTVCDSCYQQRNKGQCCPVCKHAYRHFAQRDMVQCYMCRKFVHSHCDPEADPNIYQKKKKLIPYYDYKCPLCKAGGLSIQCSFSKEARERLISEGCNVMFEESVSQDIDLDEDMSASQTQLGLGRGKPLCQIIKKRIGYGRPKGPGKLTGITTKSSLHKKSTKFMDFRRKKVSKSKIRNTLNNLNILNHSTAAEQNTYEDYGGENRMIICSGEDEFVLSQDICLMCGTFGQDQEGRLISCAQCGQCYHPYCQKIKVTKVVLQRGWRCLNCTFCEGCGQPHDESKLILCDDCDISYHIYCLNPPLPFVPEGNWKCKWCAVCQQCGATDPGTNCSWQSNYTLCGPCASLTCCPVCQQLYNDNDLVIQCLQCDRWLHGACDNIKSKADAEKCIEIGFSCIYCRPKDAMPPHLVPVTPTVKLCFSPSSSDNYYKSPMHFYMDGVFLSEMGMQHMRLLHFDIPKKRKTKKQDVVYRADSVSATIESVIAGCTDSLLDLPDDSQDSIESKGKEKNECDISYMEDDIRKHKRARNIHRLGIGGFMVKSRFKKDDDCYDKMEECEGVYSGDVDKLKRKMKRSMKSRCKLLETYPSYIQEAFFGTILTDISKASTDDIKNIDSDQKILKNDDAMLDVILEKASTFNLSSQNLNTNNFDRTPEVIPKIPPNIKEEEESEVLKDILPGDLFNDDLVNTILKHDLKDEQVEKLSTEEKVSSTSVNSPVKNNINDILHSTLIIPSTGLPAMDSKDIEELFRGMEDRKTDQTHISLISSESKSSNTAELCNLLPAKKQISVIPADIWPPTPDQEEGEKISCNQRSFHKWESEEQLGCKATISAVLYANLNYPNLTVDYPKWPERAKQIYKIWRSLSSEKRAPYLQKAKENRTFLRAQKAQQETDRSLTSKSIKSSEPDQQWHGIQLINNKETINIPSAHQNLSSISSNEGSYKIPMQFQQNSFSSNQPVISPGNYCEKSVAALRETVSSVSIPTGSSPSAKTYELPKNQSTSSGTIMQYSISPRMHSSLEGMEASSFSKSSSSSKSNLDSYVSIVKSVAEIQHQPCIPSTTPVPLCQASSEIFLMPRISKSHNVASSQTACLMRPFLSSAAFSQNSIESFPSHSTVVDSKSKDVPIPANLCQSNPTNLYCIQPSLTQNQRTVPVSVTNSEIQSDTSTEHAQIFARYENLSDTDAFKKQQLKELLHFQQRSGEYSNMETRNQSHSDGSGSNESVVQFRQPLPFGHPLHPVPVSLSSNNSDLKAKQILIEKQMPHQIEEHRFQHNNIVQSGNKEKTEKSCLDSQHNSDDSIILSNASESHAFVKQFVAKLESISDKKDIQLGSNTKITIEANSSEGITSEHHDVVGDMIFEDEDLLELLQSSDGKSNSFLDESLELLSDMKLEKKDPRLSSEVLKKEIDMKQNYPVISSANMIADTSQSGQILSNSSTNIENKSSLYILETGQPNLPHTKQTTISLSKRGPPPPYPGVQEPLLLDDFLEQEKKERQHHVVNESPTVLLSDLEFEKLKADILNLPVNEIPSKPSLSHLSSHHSFNWKTESYSFPRTEVGIHPALLQTPSLSTQVCTVPAPPAPPENPVTEQEKQQQHKYENWLSYQQQQLASQQKYFATEISKFRKQRKSLTSKQRQLRKNGQELNDADHLESSRITEEQQGLQKQLEQIRRQVRQHSILIQNYNNKRQIAPTVVGVVKPPTPGPRPSSSPLHRPNTPMSTSQSPLLSPSSMPSPITPSQQHSPSPLMSPHVNMSPSPRVHISTGQFENSFVVSSPSRYSGLPEEIPFPSRFYSGEQILMRMPHPELQMKNLQTSQSHRYSCSSEQGQPHVQYCQSNIVHQYNNDQIYQQQVSSSHSPYSPLSPQLLSPQGQKMGILNISNIYRPTSPHGSQFNSHGSILHSNTTQCSNLALLNSVHASTGIISNVPANASRIITTAMHIRQPSGNIDVINSSVNNNLSSERSQGLDIPVMQSPVTSNCASGLNNLSHIDSRETRNGQRLCFTSHHNALSNQSSNIRNEQGGGSLNNPVLPLIGNNHQNYSKFGLKGGSPIYIEKSQNNDKKQKIENSNLSNMHNNNSNNNIAEQKVITSGNFHLGNNIGVNTIGTPSSSLQKFNLLQLSSTGKMKVIPISGMKLCTSTTTLNNLNSSCQGSVTSVCTSTENTKNSPYSIFVNKKISNLNDSSEIKSGESQLFQLLASEVLQKSESSLIKDDIKTEESGNVLLKQLLEHTSCPTANQFTNALPSILTSKASEVPQPSISSKVTVTTASKIVSNFSVSSNGQQKNESDVYSENDLKNYLATNASIIDNNNQELIKLEDPQKAATVEEIAPLQKNTSKEKPLEYIDQYYIIKNEVKSESLEYLPTLNSSESEMKKLKELEIRRAKRRLYQQKRRQVQQANRDVGTHLGLLPKKKARKLIKEEDYDSYMNSMMNHLRSLQPLKICEPPFKSNFSISPFFGNEDLVDFKDTDFSLIHGKLSGTFGAGFLPDKGDIYNNIPFGDTSFTPTARSQYPVFSRGFYSQEFSPLPRVGQGKGKNFCAIGKIAFVDNFIERKDSDTPDTIVSSSSPECISPDIIFRYKGLRLIHECNQNDVSIDKRLCSSPIVPLLAPVPIRLKDYSPISKSNEQNKENIGIGVQQKKYKYCNTFPPIPLKDSGNTTVTLTITSQAAENMMGVLRKLANILKVPPPANYQVTERTSTPPSQKLDLQSILNGPACYCRHCDMLVLSPGVMKKASELPFLDVKLVDEQELTFCSNHCYLQFALTHRCVIEEKEAAAVIEHINDIFRATRPKLKREIVKEKQLENVAVNTTEAPASKIVRPTNYRFWNRNNIPTKKYRRPTENEMTDMLYRLNICLAPSSKIVDTRQCLFCGGQGDGVPDGPSRLLNYDVDKWIHLNCVLWAEDVYETTNGALVNVEVALRKSAQMVCTICSRVGATVRCFKLRCSNSYHLNCAVKDGCIFYRNKSVYCPQHALKGERENELNTLAVYRRVYVERNEARQLAALMRHHHADQSKLLRVGSLIFLSAGRLLPHQLLSFHTSEYIYPVGYRTLRIYWSMRRLSKRCQYECSIADVKGQPEFRVLVQESPYEDVLIVGNTPTNAWRQILDSIEQLRRNAQMVHMFPKHLRGEELFGLTEPYIVRVLESLPGVETLPDYRFVYGRNPLLEPPLAANSSGCARAESKLRTTHFKRPLTCQRTSGPNSLVSVSRPYFSLPFWECNSGTYGKQLVTSKSSQYKKMRQEWRNNVYLARSKIQGLGLYAARDLERHTMVIEYIGEIIRSEVAELREKRYEAQNHGVYMFRLDDDRVIDATQCGGLARYINHSCSPNCVTETVEVDRDLKIIIFAKRRISRGEELSYDYKFNIEDDQHKIPCLCGAPNCRKWMN